MRPLFLSFLCLFCCALAAEEPIPTNPPVYVLKGKPKDVTSAPNTDAAMIAAVSAIREDMIARTLILVDRTLAMPEPTDPYKLEQYKRLSKLAINFRADVKQLKDLTGPTLIERKQTIFGNAMAMLMNVDLLVGGMR